LAEVGGGRRGSITLTKKKREMLGKKVRGSSGPGGKKKANNMHREEHGKLPGRKELAKREKRPSEVDGQQAQAKPRRAMECENRENVYP